MISVLDIGLGVLFLLFLVRGLLRGMINEIAGFVGIFLGLFLAGRFYPQLSPQFEGIFSSPSVGAGVAYAVIFCAALVVVALGAAIIRRFLTVTMTAWVDNVLGAVIGSAKGLLICAIALALMQRFAADSPFLKNSVLAPHLEAFVSFARSLLPGFIDKVTGL